MKFDYLILAIISAQIKYRCINIYFALLIWDKDHLEIMLLRSLSSSEDACFVLAECPFFADSEGNSI